MGETQTIREARREEYTALGLMVSQAYESLLGMPTAEQQPEYYAMLRDVEGRTRAGTTHVMVAVGSSSELLGCVDLIEDMRHYGACDAASGLFDAAGIRLLAVKREARRRGVGRALTQFCCAKARAQNKSRVVLHTTRAMGNAWKMYESMGFVRYPEIDFMQRGLEVFGFEKRIA